MLDWRWVRALAAMMLLAGAAAVGCSDDDDDAVVTGEDTQSGADTGEGEEDATEGTDPDTGEGESDATEGEADAGEGEEDATEGGDVEEPGEDEIFPPDVEYNATIRRTSFGIPHVTAGDWGGLGFGHAVAYAQDHVCILADQILRANGRRARYYGPGPDGANLDSDFAMLSMGNRAVSVEYYESLGADEKALIEGYVAGYNHFVDTTDPNALPETCRNAEWVRPISINDYLAYLHMVVLYASGTNLVGFIASAEPPEFSGNNFDGDAPGGGVQWPTIQETDLGSNGWGIGSERTEDGSGMLVVNPHFPWEGERKFSEIHLTIPGVYDVYGTALMGAPAVTIGFNENLGWTHTVSTSGHFTMYLLSIDPENPTQYLVDGETREITPTEYEIDVLQEDGSLERTTKTLWHSHHGPMIDIPPVGWSVALAFTYRDANYKNFRAIRQWMDLGLAEDLDEFSAALDKWQGIPWVNTMYADKDGNAYFAEATPVPNLSDQAIAEYLEDLESDFFTQSAAGAGLVLLDGTSSSNEWVEDPAAAAPGIVPFEDAPKLVRKDYVANANDSHWLSNPNEPLEGYNLLWGDEGTPRTPRTRHNLMLLEEIEEGGASGADGKFSFDELTATMMAHRSLTADILRDELAQRCEPVQSVELDGEMVDIEAACKLIAEWDGRSAVDSVGPPVWREFIGSYEAADVVDAGNLFAKGFDPEDPVQTPAGLIGAGDGELDPLEALAAAVKRLEDNGFAIDAPLGSMQFTRKGDLDISIPGGPGFPEGTFNVVQSTLGNNTLLPGIPAGDVINPFTGLRDDGYVVRYGTSTYMAVNFLPEGPTARALLTYSQSSDPASPHYTDQTELFSQSQFRDVLFTNEAIEADPNLTTEEVGSGR